MAAVAGRGGETVEHKAEGEALASGGSDLARQRVRPPQGAGLGANIAGRKGVS
jgi:hypothetical protein